MDKATETARQRRSYNLAAKPSKQTLTRIFTMRSKGVTLEAIAKTLNDDGIPTPRGGKWWAATIQNILSNPQYRSDADSF